MLSENAILSGQQRIYFSIYQMADLRKTRTRPAQPNKKSISLYLLCDAALNLRNRPNTNAHTIRPARYTWEQRTELGNDLLRFGLTHHTGATPTDWQIDRPSGGGPIIQQNHPSEHDLKVSLSHSGEYLVAGICNAATIGIDIERDSERRFSDIAQHLNWPRATWDPPGVLKADSFYHLWTLWEATIKSCSADSGTLPESVFRLIAPEFTAGRPSASLTQDWFADSWRCPGHFWLSIVANCPQVPEIRLFLVNGLKSARQAPQICQIANDDGCLSPEIIRQEQSAMT